MRAAFADSPRKRTVRDRWNTPLLRAVSAGLRIKYFYLGLPGPEILDIKHWRDMIRRVIAFEIESDDARSPREKIALLSRNLDLTGLEYKVHCGYLEETVLLGEDEDGKTFEQDEVVTLYNLDFTNAITGRIPTRERPGERHCLRFHALRDLLVRQQLEHARGGPSRFILLLTVREEFHRREMTRFRADENNPAATAEFLRKAGRFHPAGQPHMARNPLLLKSFVFTAFRAYCTGQHVEAHFLPMVRFCGASRGSRMVHFTVLCRFAKAEDALPHAAQPPSAFLPQVSLRASDTELAACPCGKAESKAPETEVETVAAKFFGF